MEVYLLTVLEGSTPSSLLTFYIIYLFQSLYLLHYTDDGHSDSDDGNIHNDSDSNPSHDIYQKLTYSLFTVLIAAILVLVAAIIIVRLKRKQLITAHLLTEEQKIAVMKQIGYVNPTYKFFDKRNDG